MLKVITGQNDTAANVIPQNIKNQYRVDSTMQYNVSIKMLCINDKKPIKVIKLMYQVHIWNKTTYRTVKYYTTVHRKYQ